MYTEQNTYEEGEEEENVRLEDSAHDRMGLTMTKIDTSA